MQHVTPKLFVDNGFLHMEPIPISAIPGFAPAPVGELTPARKAPRSANRGTKVTAIVDMPYNSMLAPAIPFTVEILAGGAEHEIGGSSNMSDDEILAIYNSDPVGWAEAGRWADRLKGRVTPSPAICLHRFTAKRKVSPIPFFEHLTAKDPTPEIEALLQRIANITGEGRRVEQLRVLLLAFRAGTGMRRQRPIFPNLIGK